MNEKIQKEDEEHDAPTWCLLEPCTDPMCPCKCHD